MAEAVPHCPGYLASGMEIDLMARFFSSLAALGSGSQRYGSLDCHQLEKAKLSSTHARSGKLGLTNRVFA